MATYDWPEALIPQRASWMLQGAGEQFRGPFNGTLQVVDFVAERWVLSVTLPQARRTNAGAAEAFFMRLAGGVNRVRAWHFARPIPIGTMRGSPTLSAGVSRGATALPISGSGTLMPGDMIGCGGQLFMVADIVTLPASVPVVNRVRGTIGSGSAVTWSKPTADFIVPAWQVGQAHFPGGAEGMAVDLEEAW